MHSRTCRWTFLVILLTVHPLFSSSFADQDLALHYAFDQVADLTVRDLSGNGHDATVCGAGFVPRGDGFAIRFERPSEYLDCGAQSIRAEMTITLAFWLYLEDVPAVEVEILAKDGAYSVVAGHECWLYTYWNGKPKKSMVETGGLFPTGIWRHIALVFDGRSVRYYENGRFVPGRNVDYTGAYLTSPVAVRELAAGGPLHLGWKNNFAATDLPPLMLDDFRIYTRAFAADEVAALYRATAVPRLEVKPYPYRFADAVILRLDAGALAPLPAESRIEVEIRERNSHEIAAAAVTPAPTSATITEVPHLYYCTV